MAAEICLRLCSPEISRVGVQAQSWWFVCCHTQPGSESASGKWQQTVASAALQSVGWRWVKQVRTRAISNQNGHFWQNDIMKVVKHFQMIRFEATFCWCACSYCCLRVLTTDPHKHCFLLLAYTSTSKIFLELVFFPLFLFQRQVADSIDGNHHVQRWSILLAMFALTSDYWSTQRSSAQLAKTLALCCGGAHTVWGRWVLRPSQLGATVKHSSFSEWKHKLSSQPALLQIKPTGKLSAWFTISLLFFFFFNFLL